MDDLYRDNILDHWRDSVHRGSLEGPDITVEGMNPLCGDALHIELAIDGERVTAMRFQGEGCVISQASASILAELVEGQTLANIRDLPSSALLHELGIQLSPARVKCALLAWSVLRQAVSEAALRHGQPGH